MTEIDARRARAQDGDRNATSSTSRRSAMWCRNCMSTSSRASAATPPGRGRSGARCRRAPTSARSCDSFGRRCARRSGSTLIAHRAHCLDGARMRVCRPPPEFLMSHASISARSRSSATPKADRRAPPSGAAMRRSSPPARPTRRAGAYVIGGEMVVLKKDGERPRSAVHARRSARARRRSPRPCSSASLDGAGRFGIGIDPEATEALKARTDLVVTDLRSIAVQGLVAPEHLRRSPKPRRCCTGTRGIASAPIAARRPTCRKPAGGATARPARSSISRAPIRS